MQGLLAHTAALLTWAAQRPQTDQEEAAEVYHVLAVVGVLLVLSLVVGVLAARRR